MAVTHAIKDRLERITERIGLLDDEQDLNEMQRLIRAIRIHGLEAVVAGGNGLCRH